MYHDRIRRVAATQTPSSFSRSRPISPSHLAWHSVNLSLSLRLCYGCYGCCCCSTTSAGDGNQLCAVWIDGRTEFVCSPSRQRVACSPFSRSPMSPRSLRLGLSFGACARVDLWSRTGDWSTADTWLTPCKKASVNFTFLLLSSIVFT